MIRFNIVEGFIYYSKRKRNVWSVFEEVRGVKIKRN